MDVLLYLLLSVLDALVTLILMFVLFRFPIKTYLRDFLMIALIIAGESVLVRLVLHLPVIDPFIQTLIFILCLWHFIEVKVRSGILIVIQGYQGFILLQIFLTYILSASGFIQPGDLAASTGFKIYVIQILGETATLLVAWLLVRLNLGFSFIIRPPHEEEAFSTLTARQKFDLTIYVVLNCLTSASFYFWLHMQSPLFIVFPVVLIAFSAIYFMSYKKDYADDH